jgi:hypothetical protein
MPVLQTLRETHPYRFLLIAALAVVVLAQMAAMVMVTRSQVSKAQAFYAAQAQPASPRAVTAAAGTEVPPTPSTRVAPAGVVHVGYVVSR